MESQTTAAVTAKAASDTLVRIPMAMLYAWGRSDAKTLLRLGQDVTLSLILRKEQARRQHRPRLERSPKESHASIGAMERANRTLGEVSRKLKHASETRVGGRLETDQLLICRMVRHCCWIFCKYRVRPDGGNPFEMLPNGSYRGGLVCLGRIARTHILGSRPLRGWYEVNWLELVWLGKTDNTEKHLCDDEHGVRELHTINDSPNQPDGKKNSSTS